MSTTVERSSAGVKLAVVSHDYAARVTCLLNTSTIRSTTYTFTHDDN
jgi:hypothetical protein